MKLPNWPSEFWFGIFLAVMVLGSLLLAIVFGGGPICPLVDPDRATGELSCFSGGRLVYSTHTYRNKGGRFLCSVDGYEIRWSKGSNCIEKVKGLRIK